ncbi:MAG: hydantoinase/oxoprolinase family protein [Pseudomonadota bacterium]
MPRDPLSPTKSLRLAIDIGGTFTDSVLVDHDDRVIASAKTLTTHENPADGAMQGTVRVLQQANRVLEDVSGFVHGTTLATNALIERRGACVATITTEGFRDILEIAYERRYSQYDIALQKPDLLVPRERSLTIKERMDVQGNVLIPLNETAIDELLAALDHMGAETVAICLLHSYENPAHEQKLAQRLQAARPHLSISLSSEVSPEAREFDRLCTTVANAYIQPLMAGYLTAFASQFADAGLQCPILMMTAGGGMTTIETAARFPIRLVESGPAGGAILAARIAAESGLDKVLSFDMGGTTAKLCLIDDAKPQTARHFEIARAARFIKGSGMPVRIPVIEMIEIGAGGGSIAGVDRLGRLTVGPKSAGSEPGPVAFGRGGTAPTVTDSDIVLGYIRPETFAEGQFEIDEGAARQAIEDEVGHRLDLDPVMAADGVSRIVDESMASAARMHAVESGKDLGDRTMIAFGGNGPLHACRVARSAGVSRILVPPNPGVGSAVGFLFAPVSFEIVRSRYTLLKTIDLNEIEELFQSMVGEAKNVVRQGAPTGTLRINRTAFMRYNGQGHEIEIPLPEQPLQQEDVAVLTNVFEQAYAKQFSRPVPGMEIEILNWAVQVSSGSTVPLGATGHGIDHKRVIGRACTMMCDVAGVPVEATMIERDLLQPGDCVEGPALITEPQTTTFVGTGFSASVDTLANLILTKETGERTP